MNYTEIDRARAVFYGLFSLLFTYKAPSRSFDELTQMLEAIEKSGFDKEASTAAENLLDLIGSNAQKLEDEFEELFVLPFGNNTPITASYYFDEREAGEPLVKTKELLLLAKFIRADELFSDNEDHFGFIFGFATKLLNDPTSANRTILATLHKEIIAPFAQPFATRVKTHPKSKIYKEIAVLLDRFLAFEENYYSI